MTQPAEPTFPAYPWPEAEMIARYGLRHLTPEEQQACPEQGRRVFPGLRLVLDVLKARLTKPPTAVPRARAGWIVWVAETYPGQYHIRLPGGATLLAPYHNIAWERVPVETPATTIEEVWAEECRLQTEDRKWRPGKVITTPGTRLSWDSLAGWIAARQQLQGRAHSSDRYWKEAQHMRALPVEMITAEIDENILYDFLSLMNSGDARPPLRFRSVQATGMRAEHTTTPLVVAAHNRLRSWGRCPTGITGSSKACAGRWQVRRAHHPETAVW